jgi:hypothetical protein
VKNAFMKTVGRWLGGALAILVLAGAVYFGVQKAGQSIAEAIPALPTIPTATDIIDTIKEPEPFEDIGPVVVKSIHDLATLTTVEVVEYTTIEKGTDSSWLAWARGDSISMLAVARIGAGVDLTRMQVSSFEVDQETGTVTVELPPAEIVYAALDNDETRVYSRDTGLLTKGDPGLETAARLAAEEALVQRALDRGILEIAFDNAETVLGGFFRSLGYPEVDFVRVGSGV